MNCSEGQDETEKVLAATLSKRKQAFHFVGGSLQGVSELVVTHIVGSFSTLTSDSVDLLDCFFHFCRRIAKFGEHFLSRSPVQNHFALSMYASPYGFVVLHSQRRMLLIIPTNSHAWTTGTSRIVTKNLIVLSNDDVLEPNSAANGILLLVQKLCQVVRQG